MSPRLADIGRTRFWRIDPNADYGKLNVISQHRLRLQRISRHWDDILRLTGSLLLGRVPATGIMRTLHVGPVFIRDARNRSAGRTAAIAQSDC